jgi:nicotinamide mononucleotide transporter
LATFFYTLIQYVQQNWLEVAGVVTGFICVYLNAKENIWGWPMGIISCFLYIFFMYDSEFYAGMWLQITYVFLNAYGWYQWLYGGANRQALTVTHITSKEIMIFLPAGMLLTAMAFYYFSTYTNAAQPFWDSFNTAFSLVAVYLQATKRLESWIIWITVDIIYVPLFFFQEHYLTTCLYMAYLILATLGYFLWRNSMFRTSTHKI